MGTLAFGLEITVIGMAVVFVALYGLALMMEGFKVFTRKPATQKAPAQPVEVSAAPTPQSQKAADVSPQIIAAITAALTVYMEGRFTIRAIRRVGYPAGSPWTLAGRKDLMDSRF